MAVDNRLYKYFRNVWLFRTTGQEVYKNMLIQQAQAPHTPEGRAALRVVQKEQWGVYATG